VAKGGEHARNLIATPAIQPSYKSFILDSQNVLIRHSSHPPATLRPSTGQAPRL
jgi:hypothetical protein